MPTPDTETLAARLRAVERALTDDDAVPDPPSDGVAGVESTPETTVATAASGSDSEVADRLCRLEAAVQALHAALEERETTSGSGPTEAELAGADTHRPDRTPETTAGGTMEIPRNQPDALHGSRESTTDWPDDLAAE